MVNIDNFKEKIKGFQEGSDYSVDDDEQKRVYSLHSLEIKQIIWENDLSPGFDYKVEEKNGGFRAYKTTIHRKGGKSTQGFLYPISKPLPFARDAKRDSKLHGIEPKKPPYQSEQSQKDDFVSEEFSIYHETQITSDDVVSSGNYAVYRKQEGNKIFENKKNLGENEELFGLLGSGGEKNTDALKIREIIDEDIEMGEAQVSIVSSSVSNDEKLKKEMVEARERFDRNFTEQKKLAIDEASERFTQKIENLDYGKYIKYNK